MGKLKVDWCFSAAHPCQGGSSCAAARVGSPVGRRPQRLLRAAPIPVAGRADLMGHCCGIKYLAWSREPRCTGVGAYEPM